MLGPGCEKIVCMLRNMDPCSHHHINLVMLKGNPHKKQNQTLEVMFLKIMTRVLEREGQWAVAMH